MWLFYLVPLLWFGERATGANFATRVWLRENGLPQNKVSAVLQTRDGYIWIGTYNGLARFDGVRFVCYDSGNTPELVDCAVTSLFEDEGGTLWIGHENGEVTSYAQGRFTSVRGTARCAGKKIMNIGADEAGDIWLYNEDGLLARVRDGLVLTPESGLETNLMEMTRSDRGTIWVGRAGRVSRLQHGRLTPLAFETGQTNLTVSAIGASRDGGLWLTMEGRVRKWKDNTWTDDRGKAPFELAPMLKLMESQNGTLLGASSDHGCAFIFPDGKVSIFKRETGFPSDWVLALGEDRERNYWLGTGNHGLALIRESNIQTLAPPDAWQGRGVLSVCMDRENTMWVGTEGAGLYRWQNETWSDFSLKDGLSNPYIWSLAEGGDGELAVGTWGAGLFLRRGDHFASAPGMQGVTMPIPALFRSRLGGWWVGTRDGLFHYDPAGREPKMARVTVTAKRDVRCLIESVAGEVWFGTASEGLFCLQGDQLQQFRKTDGLPGDSVRCLRQDETGAIWIGTSAGLCRFKDHHFHALGTTQGLVDNVICDLEDDGLGCFWMSSFNGIFRVKKLELQQCADGQLASVHCQAFGIADGLPTLEGTGGGCKTADGRLWFPTGSGLVAIDPQGVRPNPLAPPVLIESLLVDNQMITNLASPSRLNIPPGRHRFEFQYTGLSFAAPEKVRFKHRLDPLDADWIDAGTKRTADYPYPPPGNYTFRVIACNNDGRWNETGAALAFTLLPHFWQTTWFELLALLAIMSLASVGAWYATRRRMRRKLELLQRQQAVERERTRIAKDIHDDLGASLTRIDFLSQLVRQGMDDRPQMEKSLEQISTTARQLTRTMDEIVWAVDPQHDTLDSLANYLGKLIHELLTDSNLRCRLDFPFDIPAWPVAAEVRHNLFLSIKEALHNVLKHSAATEVRISFALKESTVVVGVIDNGCGMDGTMLVAAERSGGLPRIRLNGVLNMRKRLEEIGGRCDIQSERGQGTQVTFYVPLTKTGN